METHGTPDGEFGIAVLSRFPLSKNISFGFSPFRGKSRRVALACKMRVAPSRSVWVFTAHLGLHYGAEQATQMRELLVFMEGVLDNDQDGYAGVFLLGDFNSLPCFRSIALAKAWRLRGDKENEESRLIPVNTSATFPSTFRICCLRIRALVRLDYMFFLSDREFSFVKVELVDSPASDHMALVSIFA